MSNSNVDNLNEFDFENNEDVDFLRFAEGKSNLEMEELCNSTDFMVRSNATAEVKNSEILEKMCLDDKIQVRLSAAGNCNTPLKSLVNLLTDISPYVVLSAKETIKEKTGKEVKTAITIGIDRIRNINKDF